MPHSLSAAKRVRQTARRRAQNRALVSRVRTACRRFREALQADDLDAAQARFREAERLLHRAACNGPIHRNTAARRISRLQRRLHEAQEAAGAAR